MARRKFRDRIGHGQHRKPKAKETRAADATSGKQRQVRRCRTRRERAQKVREFRRELSDMNIPPNRSQNASPTRVLQYSSSSSGRCIFCQCPHYGKPMNSCRWGMSTARGKAGRCAGGILLRRASAFSSHFLRIGLSRCENFAKNRPPASRRHNRQIIFCVMGQRTDLTL